MILSTADRDEWMAALDCLPDEDKDIHWLPEYVEAHSLGRGGYLFVGPGMMSTFVVGAGSPYGYGCCVGGALVQIGTRYRFHPLVGEPGKVFEKNVVEKNVVAIDLDAEDLRSKLSKGHKAAVKSAQKIGAEIKTPRAISMQDMIAFCLVYECTMDRQGAASGWRLPPEHFWRMYELMGDDHLELFFGLVDERIESACLVLHGFNIAYYHFAGSYGNHPKSGINHLMVLKVAEWAKAQGYRWLHLGGGVTSDPSDSLLTFKKGFGGKLLPVHVYEGDNATPH